MLLRIMAKIGKENAAKILAAATRTEEISKIMNFQYFRDELEANAKENLKNFEEVTEKDRLTIFEEEVGSFETPEHFINIYFGRKEYCYNRSDNKPKQKYILALTLIKETNTLEKTKLINFAISIKKKISKNRIEAYKFGDFSTQETKNTTTEFINYFACQAELYEKSFQLLETKKAIMTKYLGEVVAKDLLQLFSCKKIKAAPLDIANNKLEKILYFNEENYLEKIEKATVPLGVVMNENYERRTEISFTQICLAMKKANKLILDYHFYEDLLNNINLLVTDKNLEKIKENKRSVAFIEKNLNKWANALVDYANFENNIFNKIKTKFLIKTL